MRLTASRSSQLSYGSTEGKKPAEIRSPYSWIKLGVQKLTFIPCMQFQNFPPLGLEPRSKDFIQNLRITALRTSHPLTLRYVVGNMSEMVSSRSFGCTFLFHCCQQGCRASHLLFPLAFLASLNTVLCYTHWKKSCRAYKKSFPFLYARRSPLDLTSGILSQGIGKNCPTLPESGNRAWSRKCNAERWECV